MLPQFFHGRVWILRLPLLGRLIALPLDESAADRVVLLFENSLVAGHEFARHGVWMRKFTLGRVVDDVGEREFERLVAELHGVGLIGLRDHLVEEEGIDRGW